MTRYLFRISTKRTDVWSNKKPKPGYGVGRDKQEAQRWAESNLTQGLSVSKITKLAEQIAVEIFTGL